MDNLPEHVQWYIYKTLHTHTVLDELVRTSDFVWRNPSDRLKELTTPDPGSLQVGFNDLPDMIEDNHFWAYNLCVRNQCENCQHYGFPCANLADFGFQNPHLEHLWHIEF